MTVKLEQEITFLTHKEFCLNCQNIEDSIWGRVSVCAIHKINEWYKRFIDNRTAVGIDPGPDRPSTTKTNDNNEYVRLSLMIVD